MYVTSVEIANLRCFADASFDFRYPGRANGALSLPNVNLFLGNNGVGKTTVLKAVALAALSQVIDSAGFVPYRLVRRSPAEQATQAEVRAEVVLHAQDVGTKDRSFAATESVRVRIERIRDVERVVAHRSDAAHWENIFDDRSPAYLVVGYGASRRVESAATWDESVRRRSRQLRYERVAGLFEDHVTLTPLGSWLPRMRAENPGRYRQVANLINRLLPEGARFTEELDGADFAFEVGGTVVPFPALSDGYRAYVGWIADLLYHVCMGAPTGAKLVDNKGIVLVDEIDLHLHPDWQRTVVPRLAAALPNLQFLLTTHGPIVAGTVESSNIVVLEPDEAGASRGRRLQEQIHGKSAEQILLSSYFKLDTTRAPAMEDELQALARRVGAGDREAAVEYMRRLSSGDETDRS